MCGQAIRCNCIICFVTYVTKTKLLLGRLAYRVKLQLHRTIDPVANAKGHNSPHFQPTHLHTWRLLIKRCVICNYNTHRVDCMGKGRNLTGPHCTTAMAGRKDEST